MIIIRLEPIIVSTIKHLDNEEINVILHIHNRYGAFKTDKT